MTTTAASAASDSTTMNAETALALADPFAPFGLDPDRYAEIIFYRCRQCTAQGPVGRALPEAEHAAHTWPTDHFNAEGHEYSDRITLSRAPARTTTIRRLSKARPATRT
ncbi:hypothetical protein AB0D98_19460 [Streptomyces sp. NPDC047987]|uniref:hypothetical protein n=1 Tax=unclassified Streptomyces TaxID=2593676 RepID=UPI00343AB308